MVAAAIVGGAIIGGVATNSAASKQSKAADRASEKGAEVGYAQIEEERRQFDINNKRSNQIWNALAPFRSSASAAVYALGDAMGIDIAGQRLGSLEAEIAELSRTSGIPLGSIMGPTNALARPSMGGDGRMYAGGSPTFDESHPENNGGNVYRTQPWDGSPTGRIAASLIDFGGPLRGEPFPNFGQPGGPSTFFGGGKGSLQEVIQDPQAVPVTPGADSNADINALMAERGQLLGRQRYRYEASPDFQFQQEEGNKALDNYLARTGMRASGRALKETMRYNTGLASTHRDNALARLMAIAGYGPAGANAPAVNGSTAGYGTVAGAVTSGAIARGNADAAGIMGINSAIQGGTQNYLAMQRYNDMMKYLNGSNNTSSAAAEPELLNAPYMYN